MVDETPYPAPWTDAPPPRRRCGGGPAHDRPPWPVWVMALLVAWGAGLLAGLWLD